MPGVGQAAGVGAVREVVGDARSDGDAAERHVAGVDALGEGQQVRDDALVRGDEPAAGPPEAGHHLVEDEDDAVPVAQLPHTGEVAGRGQHDAGGAGDRLEQDGRDGLRALELDDLLEMGQGPLALLALGGGVEVAAVEVRAEEVDDAGVAVVVRPAPGVAGEVDRGLRPAVVRAVAGEDLGAAGAQPGHPHGVLVGVGAAVGEEDPVQVAGSVLADQAGGLGTLVVGVLGGDGGQGAGLGDDRLDHVGVLVADVGVHQLGGEVQQAVAGAVPDVGALGAGDDHRGDLGLGGPGVEDVPAVELVGPGGGVEQGLGVGCGHDGRPLRHSAGSRGPRRPRRGCATGW